MNPQKKLRELDSTRWNISSEELLIELRQFISEFGSFTPEWFIEVRFHLTKSSILDKKSRRELCTLSIDGRLCDSCDSLYKARQCHLWSRLYEETRNISLMRAPPCIRLAYLRKSIRKVVDYLVCAGLLTPPFYKVKMAPNCTTMIQWGYCQPDEYCHAMTGKNTLDYIGARERVKLSRELRRPV